MKYRLELILSRFLRYDLWPNCHKLVTKFLKFLSLHGRPVLWMAEAPTTKAAKVFTGWLSGLHFFPFSHHLLPLSLFHPTFCSCSLFLALPPLPLSHQSVYSLVVLRWPREKRNKERKPLVVGVVGSFYFGKLLFLTFIMFWFILRPLCFSDDFCTRWTLPWTLWQLFW